MDIFRALIIATALLISPQAVAHHTYTHQSNHPYLLFATAEMFIFGKERKKAQYCAYVIPRVKETRQYGVRADGDKNCAADVWLDITRAGDGIYTIAPVSGRTPPEVLDKPVVLIAQKGPDTSSLRARFSVADLTPAMTRDQIAEALKARGGLATSEVPITLDTKKPVNTKLFNALVAGREEGIDRESIVVITHQTGADGHFNSEPDSIVAIQHLKQTLIENGSDPNETIQELEKLYGKPSTMETKTWPGTDVLSTVDMRWAVNADGSIERDYKRWGKCGALELAMLRAEVQNPAIEGSRGRMSLQMEHQDMFGGKPIIAPGPCILFMRVELFVGANGKMYESRTTLTDAGLLTDIYNKNVFDTFIPFLAKVKRP